jgi:ketosteroid isomerase-like protein
MKKSIQTIGKLAGTVAMCAIPSLVGASAEEDRHTVAVLDTQFQEAVKVNDAVTMARILHLDFSLVLGDGRTFYRDDLLQDARNGTYSYEQQDEIDGSQSVRVWGDTAVVTAKLWVKGVANGASFDRKLWFSDTYVRTPDGWKYVFGQASLPLAKEKQ